MTSQQTNIEWLAEFLDGPQPIYSAGAESLRWGEAREYLGRVKQQTADLQRNFDEVVETANNLRRRLRKLEESSGSSYPGMRGDGCLEET